jgi:homeobox protein cut-like
LRPIIRRYQQEVDRLTARANDAETAFLSLYKVLATVMDPVPALNQALSLQSKAQRATQLELENAKLAKELDNIRKESLEIQNQEVTVRRLQDTIAHYESHLMSLVNEKVAQHTQTLRAEYQRTLDTHIEREKELSAALAKAEEQRALTQQLLDQTQQQLLHLTRRHQEELSSKQAEMELLVTEIERTNTRLATLQADNERLREQLTKKSENTAAGVADSQANIELTLVQKDLELNNLRDEVARLERELRTQKDELSAELQRTQRALAEQRAQAETLQEQLARAPSVDEYQQLKQKLAVLQQALGYSIEGSPPSSPDAVLLDKYKRLETECVTLRASCVEREREIDDLKKRLASAEHQVEEQRALIGKLEEDLSARPAVIGNVGSLPLDSASSQAPTASSSSWLSPATTESLDAESATSNQSPATASHSMLQIVLQQRDRFKQRIHDLEEENRRLNDQLRSHYVEIQTLRKDNVKLYEKIRYLQSYGVHGSSSLAAANANTNTTNNRLEIPYSLRHVVEERR